MTPQKFEDFILALVNKTVSQGGRLDVLTPLTGRTGHRAGCDCLRCTMTRAQLTGDLAEIFRKWPSAN